MLRHGAEVRERRRVPKHARRSCYSLAPAQAHTCDAAVVGVELTLRQAPGRAEPRGLRF
jgi:hypothetical protein